MAKCLNAMDHMGRRSRHDLPRSQSRESHERADLLKISHALFSFLPKGRLDGEVDAKPHTHIEVA